MNKKYRVVKNSYPTIKTIAQAEIGDIVFWQPQRGSAIALVRESDSKTVFGFGGGAQREYPEVGIIAQVKSKGWVLELEKE